MSEIGTLSLERLNNGAPFLFISNVLARAEADTNIKSKLSTQIASLKSAKEQEDEDLKISQKSLLTDDIAAADAERDGLYSGYKKAVKGFNDLPVANMAQAAKVLTQHIKDYAIDPKMQLDKETGLLINFVDDLEKKYANEVQTLSLGAFVISVCEESMIIPTIIHREDDGCRDFRFMSYGYAALHCVGVFPVRALKKRTKCCGYSKPRRWLIWVIERAPSRPPPIGEEIDNSSLAFARMRSLMRSLAVLPVSVFTNVPK